jgi:hypothetical protein
MELKGIRREDVEQANTEGKGGDFNRKGGDAIRAGRCVEKQGTKNDVR